MQQGVSIFADHCEIFNSGVERSLSVVGNEKYTELLDFISRDTNKISRVDLEARKEKYSKGIQKPRKITKSEQNVCGPDISAEMDGGLKKCYIIRKYEKEIKAEIECRGITDFPKGEDGNRKSYKQLSMMERKTLLLIDEMKNLAAKLKAREGIKPDVEHIAPRSAEMLALVLQLNKPNG